ncbi:lysophospholipid acyltransferase family protein [Rhizobium lentis]|uniref:lysophospholipid acyltransferase family protein n=1 Tax=Rhizobium lentis TaxID=1138194 RepID=UPI001A92C952|nr:lysophospholipid acyltransferase family protein [Rhizobium lentis]MBX4972925.1 1-acyl-sn-glycerol-3-phosphate acyltransferase [Rhizobium lentis]MBX4998324.1 1-acyl-sn-glycerol-3-phosphate acyltransferase [Rhizobium lentis]MBX5017233.1 1-acyl-sn-glycerol-3-phosphate acyltransferase [Rhizobium lentis]MBX5047104.1 1-acyl-sn-glycerol-3-phosphate acyltransferase [Rhizobium lentis]MBX5059116.1 1-acyl-sn-glycerol-3-phosphate acyltransferase [Rhizobium lentis]
MIAWLRIALAAVVILAVSIVLMPLQVLALRFDWRLRRWLPRVWHRIVCYCLGIRVRVTGSLEGRRPLMLCSNHSSWMDIMVMSSVADVAFIAKIEVRDWPIFGTLAKLQKSVFVVREEKRRTGDQASEIAGRMADGEIVVLFPEGTTSDGNRLLEVKSSLFGAAAMAVPFSPTGMVMVQPVSIAYTRVHGIAMGRYHRPLAAWPGDIELLPHLIDIVKCGAIDAEVSFGEAIEYGDKTNRKDVSATIATRIRRLLNGSLRGRDVG